MASAKTAESDTGRTAARRGDAKDVRALVETQTARYETTKTAGSIRQARSRPGRKIAKERGHDGNQRL
jgi:hypothetical protein